MTTFLKIQMTVLVVATIFLIWVLSSTAKNRIETANTSYQECKEKTADIEWCFKKFRPQLNEK